MFQRNKTQSTFMRDPGEKRYFCGSVISDIGAVRSNNEDNYILDGKWNPNALDRCQHYVSFSHKTGAWQVAAVFDGMGGGEMGELASRDTADIFLQAISRLPKDLDREGMEQLMRRTFQAANNHIVDLQRQYRIFGTTATVLCSNGDHFKIFHVGDSRGYMCRQGSLVLLTKDQTLEKMKQESGMYDPNDPAAAGDKHKLTSYIGCDGTREHLTPFETHWRPIMPGDGALLCSDGLYDMCSDEQILEILRQEGDLQDKTAKLVQAALLAGGSDNVTVLLCGLDAEE